MVETCPGAGGATGATRVRNAAAEEGTDRALGEVCNGVPLRGAASKAKAGVISVPYSGTSREGRLRTRARKGAQVRLVV